MGSTSLRKLFIGYSIAVIIVLLILWITFSNLRSQEKQLGNISKAREALQRLGPSYVHLKEFESDLNSALLFNEKTPEAFNNGLKKIRDDSTILAQLAVSQPEVRSSYLRLAALLHRMADFATYVLHAHKEKSFDSSTNTWHNNSRTELVTEFKTLVEKLENDNRQILSLSYSNSINLTRRTFTYVKIISAILIMILLVTFYFIYREIRNREKKQEQLTKFNEELEKQVEIKTAEIRSSEKKYRSVIEQASDAIMVTDQKGDFIEVNTALCKQFGYTKEELTGSNISLLIDPEQLEKEPIRFDLLLAGHSIFRERRMLHKNGTIIEVEANVNMLPDGRIMAIARDITERKKAAEQILKEKDLSDSVIDSLPGVFYLRSLTTGKCLRWNENFEKALGVTHEEVANSKLFDFIAEEDKVAVKEAVEKAVATGSASVEANIITKTGKVHYYLSGIPINYENQLCILGCGIDITERKKADEDLKKSEANLKTIFETTDDGYALLDENFGIISYNQRGLDFVVNELQGNPGPNNNLMDFIPPERRAFLLNLKEKVLESGNVSYEMSYKQPDDSYKWYSIRMFPVNNNENKILGLMMAVTNITEKKLMEQEMLDQKVQEQKKIIRAVLTAEEKQRNLIGQELHDNVNQILASIKMYLGMAQGAIVSDRATLLNNSVDLVDNAINEIRALSKNQVTPLKQIDLEELIQSLVDKLDDTTSLKTNYEYTMNGMVIDDDLKLNIYRIVQEQINNILKYADASRINIFLNNRNKSMYLSVEDDGKGFDPAKKRKGIGISNMINRAESFNGELELESSPGKGCTLRVCIPC